MTYLPCNDCITRITSDLQEPTLILHVHVANIPYEINSVVDWLWERYRAGITIQLHAIRVAAELSSNCKPNATLVEQTQWRLAKVRREHSDIEVVRKVTWINNELSIRSTTGGMAKLKVTTQYST